MTIAFLGLGRMGRILAGHAIADGREAVVWNRSNAATDAAATLGATVAPAAADAVAAADTVVTVLFGPSAVDEVILDADLSFRPGALWIDVTTIAPADATRFSEWASARGIRYVHAPVLGSLGPARDRALGVLLGGAPGAVEEAAHVTAIWADPTRVHCYATPAQAAAAKLVVNLGLAVAMQGLVEAVTLGRAAGLSTPDVLGVLDRTPLAAIASARGGALTADAFEAQFTVDALAKDAVLMRATSTTPLPALEAAAAALHAAQQAGLGASDFSVIGRL